MVRVVVAGGGIGGLTTALALHSRGHSVRIVEAAKFISRAEVGAGINLQAHGMAILQKFPGLGEALLANSSQPRKQSYYTRHGELITSIPKGIDAGQSAPQISIHRGVLHRLLYDTCLEQIGKDCILTGHRSVAYEQNDAGVRLEVQDTDTGATFHEEAEVLVGADGIHSPLRGVMHPSIKGEPPRQSGVHMFRGVTMMQPFLDGKTMIIAGNTELKFVIYPIGDSQYSRELQLINWVAEVAETVGTMRGSTELDSNNVSYGSTIDASSVLKHFAGFDMPFINHAKMVKDAKTIFYWPMVDRDPLPFWTDGRVALMGDSAHSMYPIGSNGGSSAIVDADALAESLSTHADPVEALKAYEKARIGTTTSVQNACRLMIPERIMDEVEKDVPRGMPVPESYGGKLKLALSIAQKGA